MKEKVSLVKHIEVMIFVLALYAQNFALIKTGSFGISALFIFLVVMSIKYRILKNNAFVPITVILVFNFLALAGMVLNQYYDYFRLLRWNMIIMTAYFSYRYIQDIIVNGMYSVFLDKFLKAGLIVYIYGLYEFIAPRYRLPLFLNILSNNPSFGKPRDFYAYYGGWVESPRVCTLFYEPSVYSVFLTITFMLLILNRQIKYRSVYFVLIAINLYMTFARTGWFMTLYCLGIFTIYLLLKNYKLPKPLYDFMIVVALLLPFIHIGIMYIGNMFVFNDMSSAGRTNSAIYYFLSSFDNPIRLLFGHSLGFITYNYDKWMWVELVVEEFSHNGYIEILYEIGLISLVLFAVYLFLAIKRVGDFKNRTIIMAIIGSILGFNSFYQIESILTLITITYCSCYYYNTRICSEYQKVGVEEPKADLQAYKYNY